MVNSSLPSRLNKFLQESDSLFKVSHLLFLVGGVFRLGFRHTFVRLCQRPESFVIVLILVNFHLKENNINTVNIRIVRISMIVVKLKSK